MYIYRKLNILGTIYNTSPNFLWRFAGSMSIYAISILSASLSVRYRRIICKNVLYLLKGFYFLSILVFLFSFWSFFSQLSVSIYLFSYDFKEFRYLWILSSFLKDILVLISFHVILRRICSFVIGEVFTYKTLFEPNIDIFTSNFVHIF